jgi:hypothetical protein
MPAYSHTSDRELGVRDRRVARLASSPRRRDDKLPNMLPLLAGGVSGALLSDTYRIESPCKPQVAAMLVPATSTNPVPTADGANIHWCAALPSTQQPTLDPTAIQVRSPFAPLAAPPTLVGAPAAIGRLDLSKGRIDQLRSEIPKENPESQELMGLVLDTLLLRWMEHCSSSDGASFESLTASASPNAATVYESRGFMEAEPDFTALGRGEALTTHRARLPAAIVAVKAQISNCDDVLDRALAESVLSKLEEQPDPSNDDGAQAKKEEKRDPWAGIKGFGMS